MKTKIFLIVAALFFALAVRPAHAETVAASSTLWNYSLYPVAGLSTIYIYSSPVESCGREIAARGWTYCAVFGTLGTQYKACDTSACGSYITRTLTQGYGCPIDNLNPWTYVSSNHTCTRTTPATAAAVTCIVGDLPANPSTLYSSGQTSFPDYVCVNGCVWKTNDGIASAIDNKWSVTLKTNSGASCSSVSVASGTPQTPETSVTTTTTLIAADGLSSSSVASTTTMADRATETTMQAIKVDLAGVARETTQQSILTQDTGIHSDTTAIKNSLDLTGQSTAIAGASTAVTDMDSNTSSVTGKFTDVQAMPESSWSWFSWTPDFGAGVCAPFTKTIYGKVITLDLCPWVANIRDALGWLFAIFAVWDIFGLTFRRVA